MDMIHKLTQLLVLFSIGGLLYTVLELLVRGRTHWSMALLGGLCFLFIGAINELLPWSLGLIWQALIGSGIVTVCELVTGAIVNLWLGWDVWDYSRMPLNLWGQVCLPYSLLWALLSLAAIFLDDWLRWRLFDEEKPHYRLI